MAKKQQPESDEWPEKKGRGPALTDAERAEILERLEAKQPITLISKEMERSRQCIYAFLASVKATGKLARMEAEAEAATMMRRVVKDADVDQTLEVLDRLDVLPKKERGGAGAGHSQFIVMVGMPGQPALTPPSQEQIVTVQQRVLAEKAE